MAAVEAGEDTRDEMKNVIYIRAHALLTLKVHILFNNFSQYVRSRRQYQLVPSYEHNGVKSLRIFWFKAIKVKFELAPAVSQRLITFIDFRICFDEENISFF